MRERRRPYVLDSRITFDWPSRTRSSGRQEQWPTLIRAEIVLQRPLGLKVEGFAKLSQIVE
jgi:hypothetical protein